MDLGAARAPGEVVLSAGWLDRSFQKLPPKVTPQIRACGTGAKGKCYTSKRQPYSFIRPEGMKLYDCLYAISP